MYENSADGVEPVIRLNTINLASYVYGVRCSPGFGGIFFLCRI